MITISSVSFVEIYEVDSGESRSGLACRPDAIGRLPADAPLPLPGDVIMLPPAGSESSDAPGHPAVRALIAYQVLRRQYVYAPRWGERDEERPLRYLATWLFVQRAGEDGPAD